LPGVVKADHAPAAFRNRGEGEGVGILDAVERDAVHRGDLVGIGRQRRAAARPQHHRRDQVAGPGGIIVEQAEHVAFAEFEPEFLVQLAQRGL
jgi:hypothetical protein